VFSTLAGLDAFHRFRLASAAIACVTLSVCLLVRYRWARWIALGWALDVLGNILVALIYADDAAGMWFPISERNAFPVGHRLSGLVLGGGALIIVALLGSPTARRHFEEEWTTALHRAYRWTAIAISACIAHTSVAGVFGVAHQVWSPVIAAGLMLIALAMLAQGKVLALPLAAAALLAHAAAHDPGVPPFWMAHGLRPWAIGTHRWCFFVGGASSVAWVPALAIALTAMLLAGPHVARQLRSGEAIAVLCTMLASGLALGGLAVSTKSFGPLKEEPSSRDDGLRLPLESRVGDLDLRLDMLPGMRAPTGCVSPLCALEAEIPNRIEDAYKLAGVDLGPVRAAEIRGKQVVVTTSKAEVRVILKNAMAPSLAPLMRDHADDWASNYWVQAVWAEMILGESFCLVSWRPIVDPRRNPNTGFHWEWDTLECERLSR
jgi:hypothetical protein